jgi:hypothetical protein
MSLEQTNVDRQRELQLLTLEAEARSEERPGYAGSDLQALALGDLVKIYVYYNRQANQPGEMVWVSVTALSDAGHVFGVVAHDLVSIRSEDLHRGSKLELQPKYIIDFRKVAKLDEQAEGRLHTNLKKPL